MKVKIYYKIIKNCKKTTAQDTLRNYRDISEFEKCIEYPNVKITEKNLIQLWEETEIQLFDVKNKIKEILFNFENNKNIKL